MSLVTSPIRSARDATRASVSTRPTGVSVWTALRDKSRGFIGLFRKGSIAQVVLATLISLFFFAVTVREQPFELRRLNLIKIFSEFQVFGVLLVCVVLQTHEQGFATEVVTIDDYGTMQTVLTLAVLPVTAYFLLRTLREMRAQAKSDLSELGVLSDANALGPTIEDGSQRGAQTADDEEDNPMFDGNDEATEGRVDMA